MKSTALVVQGGGFRTAFSAGVLDTLLISNYTDFQHYIGVSGGSMALSYFFGEQYKSCFKAMNLLSGDKNFLDFKRMWRDEGYMNIDYLKDVAKTVCPFDIRKAVRNTENKLVEFVATNTRTGDAEYISPTISNWVDVVIASSTLPFVTKGQHNIAGKELMDGGWSDPLPIKHAYNSGAKQILVVRTAPQDLKISISWTDYFGTIYHKDNKPLSECFANSHEHYNAAIDFINDAPDDVKILQIAPEKPLDSGTYSYSLDTIRRDYRYGISRALDYLSQKDKFC